MNDSSTAQSGGSAAAPAAPQTPQAPAQTAPPTRPPRNDAEAAQLEAAAAQAQPPAAEGTAQPPTDPEKEKSKRNRTREYIERLQQENITLRRQVGTGQPQQQTQRPAQGAQQDEPEPKIEDFDFDQSRWMQAMIQHGVRKGLRDHSQQQQQTQANESADKTVATYNARAFEFSEQHPDFREVVASIAYPLPEAVQFAIMGHDMGAELAYHLGNNDDDAFTLASMQPHLAAAAVERIASRLKAAQQPPAIPAAPAAPAATAAASAPPPQTNHLSNAPPPAPTVGGRAPVEPPPEKMTDDEWYKRRLERQRKR